VSRRKRLTVSARVAVAVAAVLAFGVLALSVAAYARVAGQLSADLDRSLLREAEAYNAALSPSVAGGSDLRAATRAYLNARAQSFSGTYPVLLVRFASGSPLVISNSDLLLETAPGNATALDPRTAHSQFLDLTINGVAYRAATVPIHATSGGVEGVFEAALPSAPTRDLGVQVLITLLGVAVLVIGVGTLIAVLAARASLRPLTKAAATASRVTQSSLTERIDYDGPDDEVGRMVASTNAMLDRLEGAFGEQRKFTADASHELRTPLAVISGHVDMLRDVEMGEQERAEELALIADEVARMARLVDDLLSLARLEAGAPTPHQPLEMASLLEEAAARGRGLGDRDIRVSADLGLWVNGDPDQLMQAFLNLVGNAVAHTTDGSLIALGAAGDGSRVTVTIADDGPGIRAEDLERVFDRFYRAQGPRPGNGGGSGLGLAITERLIELHGGTIAAGNRPEGGAAFTVRLPRIPAPA
jgi:signal transduction histidine kinase